MVRPFVNTPKFSSFVSGVFMLMLSRAKTAPFMARLPAGSYLGEAEGKAGMNNVPAQVFLPLGTSG
jgi:hypothetical protein